MNDKKNLVVFQLLIIISAFLLMISGAWAANAPAQERIDESYRCESRNVTRLFSLNYPKTEVGGGCQVLYERSDSGEPVRAIWRAKYDLQFCVDRMRGSVDKLVNAGWQCTRSNAGQGEQLVKATPSLNKPILIDKTAVATSTPLVKTAAVVTPKPVKEKPGPEYDDWFHRWDQAQRRLVFTLSNTEDGSKVRSYAWRHRGFPAKAKQPSNVVFIQNQQGRSLLIVAWPVGKSQIITAIDPIRQDKPFCEIKTQVLGPEGWGFGIEKGVIVLTGQRALPDQPGQLQTVREECAMADAE